MVSRQLATSDQLIAMQQGMEASMKNHREQLLLEFRARLEHACNEAADSAFHRAQEALTLQLAAVGDQLQGHIQQTQRSTERLRLDISEVSDRLGDAEKHAVSLQFHADTTDTRLEEIRAEVAAEVDSRGAQCKELSSWISHLRAELGEESRQRGLSEAHAAGRLEETSTEAAEATRKAVERADDQLKQLREQTEALEVRLTKHADDHAASCMEHSRAELREAAGHLRSGISDSVARSEQEVAACQARMEELVKASAGGLRGEQVAASREMLTQAMRFADQKAEALAAELRERSEHAGAQSQSVSAEASSALHDAVIGLEHLITDVHYRLSTEVKALRDTMPKGDSLWTNLNRAMANDHSQRKSMNMNIDTLRSSTPSQVAELPKLQAGGASSHVYDMGGERAHGARRPINAAGTPRR